jgi:signal transduction histidine kinase/ActR/RegA family two-component response regulator
MTSIPASLRRLSLPGFSTPRLSIRHILIVITAGLTLMIALLAGRDLYANTQRLEQAYDLRSAVTVSDQLFDATSKIAVERDLALAMLQSEDNDTIETLAPSLADSRASADQSVARALSALEGSSELEDLRRELQVGHAQIQALRPQIDSALRRPRAQRDPALAQLWESAATDLMASAEQLWLSFIAPYTTIEPVVAQHLRYRSELRTITDYTGRERSIIGQILTENRTPSPERTAALLRAQGVLDLSWRSSRIIAEQSGLYPVIAAEYVDAESHYATLSDMTRQMFYVPGARAAVYPIGADLWFELSSQAAESLGILREASRAATRAYLDRLIAATERAIWVQALISIAALVLAGAGMWLVLARVVAPIRAIAEALTRAIRGEPADFTLDRQRGDEIGKLAAVLDAFQSNVAEIRRTSAERDAAACALEAEIGVRRTAEEKAQAQLERLSLLHQISRAIGERQDLNAIFDVAIANVEDRLPADFACAFLHAPGGDALEVARVGAKSAARAQEMGMATGAFVSIDANGLSRCMTGRLVYEPEFATSAFPFPQRLAAGGLKSFVAAPLQVESQVFGALIVGRTEAEAFSSGECEFLRQLSEHVALAANQAQLNAALQQAYDDLRQTQEAAMQQERLRALGQMASGIAHDINNALSPIALYTESLLATEPGLSSAGRNKLEIVQRAIDDAARTISRMSEFYKKRDRELSLAPVDANTLVQQVLDLTQARWRDMPQARGEVIEVRSELAPSSPAVLGVESELREALTNLVFNAIDALPPGGGNVTIRTRRLPPQGPAGAAVAIEVEDDGVGMDEATRQRCLEPFFTTKGERGTGLGLAMVYGAVQRHGGEVAIESAPGEGALVRLTFPLAAASGGAAASVEGEMRPRARLRLLIIDDDPILMRSLRDVLEGDGHVVAAASNGIAGVDAFNEALGRGAPFDAVITDLGMPGMDGRRVAASIKQNAPDSPVILLTGWGERLRAEEDIPEHIDCILSKPPKLREIRAALAQCCGAETAARTARG